MNSDKEKLLFGIRNSQVHQTVFLAQDVNISDSFIGENSKIYRLATIINSHIESNSIIGDLTKIEKTKLGKSSNIQRYNLIIESDIGDYSYTGPNCIILHSSTGRFCSISWNVSIGPANHDYSKITTHAFLYNGMFGLNEKMPVLPDRFVDECSIGNDVWIGANSTILRNVRIGDGAVIGAHSLVNKDVPPYAIVTGIPAEIKKFRFDKETIQELLELRWWDMNPELIAENIELFNMKPVRLIVERLKELK